MVTKLGRPKRILIDQDQPRAICYKCGIKYGSFKCGIATWYKETCGVCGVTAACTEPRDFGYLLEGWKARRDNKEETAIEGHANEVVPN